MPHLVFYERGDAPSTRSVRELTTLARSGWDITVAHHASAAALVQALGPRSCLLPEPPPNPFNARLSSELSRLSERREQLNRTVDTLAERIRATTGETAALGARRNELTRQIDELVRRIAQLRAEGHADGATAAREELENAKIERTAVAAQMRTVGSDERSQLDAAKAERTAVVNRMRAIYAVRRTSTPLTAGVKFGDLARLELRWHDAAMAMATIPADLLWAADLDALQAVIWASDTVPTSPTPVIFDSHELFCDIENLPQLYREAWNSIAVNFIPRATVVLTVADAIAQVLAAEYGACRTVVIPNYAVPNAVEAPGLRATLGLPDKTPLAVHVGNVSTSRNPSLVLDVLADLQDLHIAFVGFAREDLVADMRARADARRLAQRLHFVPPVALEALTGFIADADLSLILYTGDQSRNLALAMPNKLFDSLAAGVPVIAPYGTAAADFVIENSFGRAFEPGQSGQLTAAIRDLLADLETAGRVRQQRERFLWTELEPVLLDLVTELTAKTRSPALPDDFHLSQRAGAPDRHDDQRAGAET